MRSINIYRGYSLRIAFGITLAILLLASGVNAQTFLFKFGTYGSGDGQFISPEGVAVDGSGNIYVGDFDNHRIQKYNSSGNFLLKFNTLFSSHIYVAVDSLGNVYVADFGNNRIQKFDSYGNFLFEFGGFGSGDGQFDGPIGIAVDNSGNIYVADVSNFRIQKFDSSGNFLLKFGILGSGDGQFNYPNGIAVDSSGNIYVADINNFRIQKFDSSGNFQLKFGSPGSGDGQFFSPDGVVVDGSGSIYVDDTGNNRIQKFDSSGNFLLKFGTSGSSDGQFFSPMGIAVDGSGNIYVADTGNSRVQVFEVSGTGYNQPPVADFIYSPLNPTIDQTITFDASPSYDPDGNITSYSWNINGNMFTTEIVNISFPFAGTYYAELTVTDNNGTTTSSVKWIYVTTPPPIPPENDDFNNATVIGSLPFIHFINTFNATNAYDDPYSCVWYYGHTVWYSFTPNENMRIEVNPTGSDFSPILLAAYQGSRGSLYQVACNLIYISPDYTSQPLVVYAYANQPVFFMVGSYGSDPGGNLRLKVDIIPPLTINLSIDPDGSVNRLTGDAMIHGTLTCSRPASGSMSGNLSQRAGRFNVFRGSFGFQFWCDSNSTTWNATVRSSNGPFNAGQASAEAFAYVNDWSTGEYADDEASIVVHLKGK